jgi:hypothetical protein
MIHLDRFSIPEKQRSCLHLSMNDNIDALASRLLAENSLTVSIARIPRGHRLWPWSHWKQTSAHWVSKNLGCSRDEARKLIRTIPVPVNESLRSNPYNPLRFLGVLVAMSQQTDVLLYETGGMDPGGRHLLHTYVSIHCPLRTVFHVSPMRVEDCELREHCFSLATNL